MMSMQLLCQSMWRTNSWHCLNVSHYGQLAGTTVCVYWQLLAAGTCLLYCLSKRDGVFDAVKPPLATADLATPTTDAWHPIFLYNGH